MLPNRQLSPTGHPPFEADVSPLPGPMEEQDQFTMDQPTFQLDKAPAAEMNTIPSNFDPFSAVRDFVSKDKISLKQVHKIIDKQNQ